MSVNGSSRATKRILIALVVWPLKRVTFSRNLSTPTNTCFFLNLSIDNDPQGINTAQRCYAACPAGCRDVAYSGESIVSVHMYGRLTPANQLTIQSWPYVAYTDYPGPTSDTCTATHRGPPLRQDKEMDCQQPCEDVVRARVSVYHQLRAQFSL